MGEGVRPDVAAVPDGPAEAPRDFPGLRDLLFARREALPKRLAQVAAFTIAHPDDIAFGTAASIAEAAEVQPSTLVRFAQALGYAGFSDLQAVFRGRLRDRQPDYEERLRAVRAHSDKAAKTAALFEGFTEAAEQSLIGLRERLDPMTIDRAADILAHAETVYLVGQRRSFPVTAYVSYAMGKLGIRNVLIGSGMGTDPETLAFASERDAALAVSFTPYAAATIAFARQLAEQGVPTVVLTDSPFSPLVQPNGVWFEVVEADFEGFRPLSATMTLAMTLAIAAAEARR